MDKTLTSRELILSASREIAITSGLQALNIRDIAHKCGVSTGTIYNYFPSKGDLTVATVALVWTEIFYGSDGFSQQLSFIENLQALFSSIEKGYQKYPSFFNIHALTIAEADKNRGRKVMKEYFAYIKSGLLETLQQDSRVKEGVFTESFTQTAFVDFIFSNFITLLVQGTPSCDILLEVVRRTIY